jgi:hypothetical protein
MYVNNTPLIAVGSYSQHTLLALEGRKDLAIMIRVDRIARNLSGVAGRTSSWAVGDIAFEFTGARKLPHPAKCAFDKVEMPSRETE